MLHVWFFCVFYTSILLALLLSGQGQSAVIGPIQPIVATDGDDIILSCYLYPTMDASDMTVEWTRPDLEPRLVHVRPERAELQNPSYKGRTSLFIEELKHGEISLKISKVKLSDEGTYKCFVPDLRRDSAVRLIVGAASSPVVKINRTSSSRVVLQCESAGWYPEPELLWLDAEGSLLSAGPTETLRGPDDLYTVSSRVTVEKRHGNNFTCRVQQKNIKQYRETHIHVPDDFFMVISPSGPPSDPTIDPNAVTVSAIGAVVVLMILAVFFVVWKRRQVICRNKKKSEEDGPEQTRKEIMMDSKNDNRECHVVVEEGESEPLIAGREEEDDVVSRGEQRHEEERETKQDQFVLETEQTKENPQEKRINSSAVLQKESLITIEKETQEDVTGRQERNDVGSRGEQSNKDERETKDHQEELKEGLRRSEEERKQSVKKEKIQEAKKHQNIRKVKKHVKKQNDDHMEVDDAAHSQYAAITQQHETMKWTKEQQMLSEQKETQGYLREHDEDQMEAKEYSGLQFPSFTEEHKEQPVLLKEAKPFNLTSHLNSHQEPWREKEKQNEQLVEKRQRESDESRKTSDTEKKRSEKNRSGVNKIYSIFKAPKKTREHQREKLESEQQREKNQNKKQSETRMEREKDETEVKIRKSKNQHHKEEKTQERNEEESENEKHGEENQRDRMGMTERKTEEQRDQEESRNSSVSSKVTVNTDLKTQEKEPEEKCEQSREEIREQPVFLAGAESFNFTFHLNTEPWREKEKQQPEKQRRAQSEGGGQREMMEINEGVTSDGTNRKEREKLQLRHEGALQAEQQENVNQKEEPEEPVSVTERGVDCLEEPQKEELMELDETSDVDQHNMQSRKHTQEIKVHKVCEQSVKKQKIQEAKKHQNVRNIKRFVKKQNDDHMEVDDAAHSQYAAIKQQHETMKWTKEQQMLSEQKETQGYLREHDEDQMEVEEHSRLQFPPFTQEHKEQPLLLAGTKSFNLTFHLKTDQNPWREKEKQQPEKQRRAQSEGGGQRGVLEEPQKEELRDETPDADQHNMQSRKHTQEIKVHKVCEQSIKNESMNSSVSSKVTANTDLKTQEKEPEEKSEQNREEIREQPEKQRRAQSEGGGQREMMEINEGVTSDGTNRKEREKLQLRHEGALQAEQQENVNQKEEPEEPVSVTERGVDCLEEPQKEELRDETPDADQHNMQSRKHTQELKLHEVCNLPAKKQKIQEEGRARKHQNVRKLKKFVKKQNDDHMQVDDAAHSQYAAITQQHETIKWTKEQQMLSEQKETQGYLREHDEDQMEVD